MNQQEWLDLWHRFLQVMSGEPIAARIAIGMAIAFFATMSITGMIDSFLPRRAARRYAAMYDLTLAIAVERQSFTAAQPATPAEEPALLEPDEPDEASGDLRFADGGVNDSAARRSAPPPPKVFRARKP